MYAFVEVFVCHKITANVRVFTKAGNLLFVQPGKNTQSKIAC